MTPLLYVASSSFSGSTLLSFLLNTHPDILTVGELEGWPFAPSEPFYCSCGVMLGDCPFFSEIGRAFEHAGLRFAANDFGTRYRVMQQVRLNRYFTAELPWLHNSRVERLRDSLVARVPRFARRLAIHDRSNVIFIRTALAAGKATVFLDASKDPYRLRHLRRIKELDVRIIHLVRDPRGVVLSNMKKKNQSAALAIRLWLTTQVAITRIAAEFTRSITVYYEDLCSALTATLAAIQRFAEVAEHPAPVDYRAGVHHILGNEMRLAAPKGITNDVRWQQELAPEDLRVISAACGAFRSRYPTHPVTSMLRRYPIAPTPAASGLTTSVFDTTRPRPNNLHTDA